jgi:hypothetical protein
MDLVLPTQVLQITNHPILSIELVDAQHSIQYFSLRYTYASICLCTYDLVQHACASTKLMDIIDGHPRCVQPMCTYYFILTKTDSKHHLEPYRATFLCTWVCKKKIIHKHHLYKVHYTGVKTKKDPQGSVEHKSVHRHASTLLVHLF